MGMVTVITSGKGGTGKSTVTAGLGAALVRRGNRVLTIDCDAGMRGIDLISSAGIVRLQAQFTRVRQCLSFMYFLLRRMYMMRLVRILCGSLSKYWKNIMIIF